MHLSTEMLSDSHLLTRGHCIATYVPKCLNILETYMFDLTF